ncbi:uncharacterized protein LOC105223772 [Bactrocera dorsalis]|uniref:Uncharacterized protein LOC105223772 n=1 Tax=Bactrocera dorsalis TaxID=27457 RepID=A0A6I9VAM5_BACDO|nr:uncharacterized protein LOC105223772 [Bactrocera dorsalis]
MQSPNFIFSLLIVVVVVIIGLLYIEQPEAPIKNSPTNGQSDSTTNKPINSFELNKDLDKYDKKQSCKVKINGDMLDNSPILTPHNQLEYMQPNSSGEIVVPHGHWLSFHCADKFAEPYGGQTLQAQCAGDKDFFINNEKFNFSKINCTTISMPTPIRTGLCCSGEGTELFIFGIKIDSNGSRYAIPTMQVCFDKIRQIPRYVKRILTPASIHRQIKVKRTNFTSGDFFGGIDIDHFYKLSEQIKALRRQIGENALIYVTEENRLTRGHLAPKADMTYSGQQKGTFHHVNVMPQWQSFNAGNWSHLEDDVRQLAHDSNRSLIYFTGTCGVCRLPDENNIQQELYLGDDNNVIPVPKLFYIVVIDADSRKGIAIVGVNNPYLKIDELKTGGYLIAEDVSDDVDWIKWDRKNIKKGDRCWNRKNIKKGYCYAVSVPDFVKVVKDLPLVGLETTGILRLKEQPI